MAVAIHGGPWQPLWVSRKHCKTYMAEVTEWQHSTHVKQRSSAALVGKGVAAAMQNVVVVAVMQNKGVAVAVV